MATNRRRLAELGMNTVLAKEVGDNMPAAAVANVATVATADASDLPTAIALTNALKTRLNQLITALKA